MKTPVILIVDDEDSIIDTLKGSLEDDGHIVLTASDGNKALAIIKNQPIDIVFLDVWLPGMDGLSILRAIKDFNASIEVVMMTGHGSVNTAVLAIKDGAFDFLEKPFSLDAVFELINKIAKKQQSTAKNGKRNHALYAEEGVLALTGRDQSISKIKKIIPEIARSEGDVLLIGKAGTGKEFVSRLIYSASKSNKSRLIKVNCAFYVPQKLEGMLFGFKKGDEPGCSPKSASIKRVTAPSFWGRWMFFP